MDREFNQWAIIAQRLSVYTTTLAIFSNAVYVELGLRAMQLY